MIGIPLRYKPEGKKTRRLTAAETEKVFAILMTKPLAVLVAEVVDYAPAEVLRNYLKEAVK